MGLNLVDVELPGDLAAIEKQLHEAVLSNRASDDPKQQQHTVKTTPATDSRAESDDGDDVPVKLRGKSRAEIIEYYRNLESAYGRQANDLGTQRKLTDKILDLKRESDLSSVNPNASRVEIKTQDLLDNPTEAIDRAVEARIKKMESENASRLAQAEAALARDQFLSKHADYETVANDPEFVTWLTKSQYRVRAAQQARNGDWQAADDLLSEFKERKAVKPREEPVNNDNVDAARKAALESGNAAPSDSAARKSGKTYRRADLMRLRAEKPDVYYEDAFQAEILKAYAEKRVI